MRKPRVIIFDDEAVLLELLEFCFVKWGYEVFSYRTPMVCPFSGVPQVVVKVLARVLTS